MENSKRDGNTRPPDLPLEKSVPLDEVLEKKLVIAGKDLNLWYALQQSAIRDEEIGIEMVSYRCLKF